MISWNADNRSLFIWYPSAYPIRIYRLDTDVGKGELSREIVLPDRAGIADDRTEIYMTPDGGSYCYSTQNAPNDLYLVEGLQ